MPEPLADTPDTDAAIGRLQALLDDAYSENRAGALLAVDAPLHGLRFQGAAGPFRRDTAEHIRVSDGFRIASMSKTFTAILVMGEIESGRLRLGDNLHPYLPADLVARVHPEVEQITIRHLLNHTAGLSDFAQSRDWARELRRDPLRFRPPAEILDWALAHGEAVGAPGVRHVYSDTGYVILGRLLEIITDSSYASLCRTRIIEPLGMSATWLEGHEPPCSTLSHCYAGDWDALGINGCVDWAAGGHVSTLGDLDAFLKGFLRDQRLLRAETLDAMLTTVPTPLYHYGLGIRLRHESLPDMTLSHERFWGHAGHWGSFMYYIPALRVTIAGTENVTGRDQRALFQGILGVLHDLEQHTWA